MSSDQETVCKILKGDMGAFEMVVQNNQRLVGHIVGRLVHDKDDAKDLCQEVFIKVYHHLKTFKFQSKLSTWIGSIAYKESLNLLKKRKRFVPITENDEYHLIENEAIPDKIFDRKQASEYVHSQIALLPEQYKIILVLYHIEEMSYEEIVGITGMPEGTVKNYLFRARKLLKEKLLNDSKVRLYEKQ
jgi:RNA polymerase sigma factor (sigma-70 family)